MPFEPSIVGAIAAAINLALKVHKEFGDDIKSLGRNLELIKRIICNAEDQLKQVSLREFGPEQFDLGALDQIVGNYSATLRECDNLILNNAKFIKDGSGFVSNIVYNFNVEPEAARLKERVGFHNIKILMVLEPLEIKMISELQKLIIDLHQDQAERLEEILARLAGIHGQLVKLLGQDSATDPAIGLAGSIDINVPDALAQKFETAVSERHEAVDTFPVEEGLNAFFEYFKEGFNYSQVQDYLNLMKCAWIMSRLIERLNAGVKAPGSLYDTTVRRMRRAFARKAQWGGEFTPDITEPRQLSPA
ncbi:hypothetical protein GP486_003982 [Trichoglossum hirsutum]|uniref:Fungal N-terminal domain-containing protein n=1 Tax=Trichoglossum hirsutum TaxID=265104 RepID=A0A9P8LBU9_9PEZI|nr:hypothetical protein GP486_003982 [Trichoglossum hirsutum]